MKLLQRLARPVAHKRAWFKAEDGTFYRNCPLIMAERKRIGYRPWLSDELADEWGKTFREGVQRKAELGPDDYVVKPASFRDAYPDRPELWGLDMPVSGEVWIADFSAERLMAMSLHDIECKVQYHLRRQNETARREWAEFYQTRKREGIQ